MIWSIFLVMVLLLARMFGGPFFEQYTHQKQADFERLMTAALIIAMFLVLDRLVRRFYWEGYLRKRRNRETPKLIQDIVSIVLFAFGLGFALWWQEGLTLTGIAATSLAIAAGIGVALEPDIQDVFAGLAMNFEGSYSIGDWVSVNAPEIKDPIYGCISGTSWRSTYITLETGNRASIPNHMFTSNVVVNHSHPVGPKRLSVDIGIDVRIPSDRVIDMLLGEAFKAVRNGGLSRTPDPEVIIKNITSAEATYEVQFWAIPGHIAPSSAKSIVYRALQDVLLQNELPLPVQQVELTQPPNLDYALGAQEIHDALANASLFRNALNQAQRDELGRLCKPIELPRGGILMKQGDAANAMYIVLEGAISISIGGRDAMQHEVAVSAAGDVVGEMSLMTGAPRTATVTALTRLRVLEITKEAISKMLTETPELFQRFSRVLAQRQLELDALANRKPDKEEVEEDILARMKSFFSRAFRANS
jgi:small-conductance mechanosensitive channel/CRP-like cAMP-binding protein